jgi:hypothetical protein
MPKEKLEIRMRSKKCLSEPFTFASYRFDCQAKFSARENHACEAVALLGTMRAFDPHEIGD